MTDLDRLKRAALDFASKARGLEAANRAHPGSFITDDERAAGRRLLEEYKAAQAALLGCAIAYGGGLS